MQALIKDCLEGKIDTVLVFKLDRLSRSQKDTLYLIEEIFNAHDIGFISIRENFDTTSPFGKAMIGVLSVFAQLERETILERTRMGLRKRAEDGYWRGGGKVPFAYDYDKTTGMLRINQERKVIFDLMKTLRLQGYSYAKLEKITGYDEAWIQGILKSPTNLGKNPYKGKIYPGKHEKIISEEEYLALQKIDQERSQNRHASHYLLSGKIYCGKCTAKYRYQKWGKRIICYCYSQQKSKPKYIKNQNCSNQRYESYEIEEAFLEQLFSLKLDKQLFKETFNLKNINVKDELKLRFEKIAKKITNLINLLAEGYSQFEIKKELNKLSQEKNNILKELETIKDNDLTLSKSINLRNLWSKLSNEEQKNIVNELLEKVIVDNNTLKFYWYIN